MTDYTKRRILKTLKDAFQCTLAALLILGLIQPFGLNNIAEHRILYILGECLLVFISYLFADMVLLLIPGYRRFEPQNLKQFFLQTFVFYLLFIPVVAYAILCFNYWYCDVPVKYIWYEKDGSFSLEAMLQMSLWVLIIGLFIVVWEAYRFRNRKLEQELVDVRAINALLEERQQQLADASELPAAEDKPHAQVVLQGNAQNATLALCPDDIIYIESMSNYADIVYIEAGETRHSTLRITLKQLREQLADAECLVQCHRAFLVNLNFVRNLSVRSAGTYELELFGMEKKVPVSRTNADAMKHHLEH